MIEEPSGRPPVTWKQISDSQREPLPHANYIATVYHGIPDASLLPGFGNGKYLAFLGRISPEKAPDAASPQGPGVPHRPEKLPGPSQSLADFLPWAALVEKGVFRRDLYARLAEKKGTKTRAILKLVGRAAFVFTAVVLHLLGWVFSAVWAVIGFLIAIKRTTERITERYLYRQKKRRARLAAAQAAAAAAV